MKLTQFVYPINSFNPIDFQKNQTIRMGRVAIFKLKICISCLRDKVYIFGRIFMNITQLVNLINSFNTIDFEKKNQKISMGNLAILSSKFAFLVYAIKSTFLVGFLWNLHCLSISSTA